MQDGTNLISAPDVYTMSNKKIKKNYKQLQTKLVWKYSTTTSNVNLFYVIL